MVYGISLTCGALIAGMIALNGILADYFGLYVSTAIVHFIGLILLIGLLAVKKQYPWKKVSSYVLYLGGFIGIFTNILNSYAFGKISVSAILAIGLLGQTFGGIVVDSGGHFGTTKRPFATYKFIGLAIVLLGIVVMSDSFSMEAYLASFVAGALLILLRVFNARLAEETTLEISTFFNYLVGFSGAMIAVLLLGRGELSGMTPAFAITPFYAYLGAVLSIGVNLLCSMVALKMSALYFALILFIGQGVCGVAIDFLMQGTFVPRILIGCIFVILGMSVNIILERKFPIKI